MNNLLGNGDSKNSLVSRGENLDIIEQESTNKYVEDMKKGTYNILVSKLKA